MSRSLPSTDGKGRAAFRTTGLGDNGELAKAGRPLYLVLIS